jgi:hypothetical protein
MFNIIATAIVTLLITIVLVTIWERYYYTKVNKAHTAALNKVWWDAYKKGQENGWDHGHHAAVLEHLSKSAPKKQ